jgi:hypothetical protein
MTNMQVDAVCLESYRKLLEDNEFDELRVKVTQGLEPDGFMTNVCENAPGGPTFEYDKPTTQFGQFHNADIDKIAQSLDDHLLRLINKVSA